VAAAQAKLDQVTSPPAEDELRAAAAAAADLSRLQVETKDLDESGAAGVREGQEVVMLVTALDCRRVARTVTRSARQPSTDRAGDACCTATVSLPQPDPVLRWGMTVRIESK
jgi:hypothetical protein